MKHAIPKILLTTALLIYLLPAVATATEERTAYEYGDGHWIYFGPAQSPEWTTTRKMPLKRSLEQSIRGDALRHYEMPQFVLPESGVVISFHDGADRRTGKLDRDTKRGNERLPVKVQSPRETFELPESGTTIEFPRVKERTSEEKPTLARHRETPH